MLMQTRFQTSSELSKPCQTLLYQKECCRAFPRYAPVTPVTLVTLTYLTYTDPIQTLQIWSGPRVTHVSVISANFPNFPVAHQIAPLVLGLSSRGAWQSEKTEKRNTCISRFWTNSIESLWICSACSVVWLSLDFSHFVQLAIWVPCDPGFCWEQITNNHYTFGAFAAYSATLDSLSPSNHGLVVFDLTCRFGHPGQNFNTSKWHGGEHRTIVSSQLAVTMFKHV